MTSSKKTTTNYSQSLQKLKRELVELKLKLHTNKLKDTSLIKKTRKKIAILKTKMNL